ncbi:phosphate/phosphite/phosphonate ABC transporter substrate-binding protein [Mucisphaera sp.]|uniref:phosphate/phosphite/phosphonate ABC transporter substrate-binding protein n=1 Tax=Mucisphaera sp. TaxID=2913024 RepID=UPI003D10EC33
MKLRLNNFWRSAAVCGLLIGAVSGFGCGEREVGEISAETEAIGELTFIFQKQKEPDALREAAAQVGTALEAELGVPVRVVVPGDYSASVQALVSQTADVAYVSSLPFLLARRDGGARLLLAEERTDLQGVTRTEYDSLMVVPVDSDLQDLDDLKAQAGEVRFCFTSPTSTSGYVFPRLRLVQEEILAAGQEPSEVFGQVSYGGGYAQALREVLDGRADVAAVSFYTVEGPRADVYLTEAERTQLRVLARTPGVPTHVVCVRSGLSEEWAERIKQALLKLGAESPELLSDVYGTARMVETDEDAHVSAAVAAVEATGLPLTDLNR